jgi:hypothetical protein
MYTESSYDINEGRIIPLCLVILVYSHFNTPEKSLHGDFWKY